MICRVAPVDRCRCLPPAIHFSDAHKDIVAVFYIRYRIVDRLQPVAAVSQCGSHYLTDPPPPLPPSLAQRVSVFSMIFDTEGEEAATRSSFVLFPERSGQCLHYSANLLSFSFSDFLSNLQPRYFVSDTFVPRFDSSVPPHKNSRLRSMLQTNSIRSLAIGRRASRDLRLRIFFT